MSGRDFAREINLAARTDLDPNAAALDFAARARAGLEAELARRQGGKRFAVYVDGKEGAAERTVHPGGTILYRFSMLAEVVVWALGYMRGRSPVGPMPTSGRLYTTPFRDSFWIAVAGRIIQQTDLNPASIPDDAEIIIGNLQPFNRKVEVQFAGRRPIHFNVPAGLYADAAKAVQSRFGNFCTARKVYSIDFPGRYRLKQSQFRTGTRSHSVKRWAGELVDSPALIITPN